MSARASDAEPALLREYTSGSASATEALGERLGARLPRGAVLALDGELGAGKTVLVRGLARGLGSADPVSSPTFVLMHEVRGGRLPLFHFDAWRSGREASFLEGGGADYLGGEGVAVLEWAERVAAWLPCPRLALRLAHRGPSVRGISVALVPPRAGGPREEALAAALRAAVAALPPSGALPEPPSAPAAPGAADGPPAGGA